MEVSPKELFNWFLKIGSLKQKASIKFPRIRQLPTVWGKENEQSLGETHYHPQVAAESFHIWM